MKRVMCVLCAIGAAACGTKTSGTSSSSSSSGVRINYAVELSPNNAKPAAVGIASGTGGGIVFNTGDAVFPKQVANRTILIGDLSTVSDPTHVVGSVVHIAGAAAGSCKQPTEVSIVEVSPQSILKTDAVLTSKALSDVWFNEIIEHQTSASVGYLVFSANMTKDDRAEVMLQDVALVSIENFDASTDSLKLKNIEARPLPTGTCGRYVITRLITTAISYKIYSKDSKGAGISATLNLQGKKYNSYSRVQNDLRVAVQLQPLGYSQAGAVKAESPKAPEVVEVKK